MGVITEMTSRATKKVNESKKVSNLRENSDDMKARMLESAAVKLDTCYSKYANLHKLMESADKREQDAAAVTVRMLEAQQRYLENSKQMFGEATVTAGFQNLLPKLLDIVAKQFAFSGC